MRPSGCYSRLYVLFCGRQRGDRCKSNDGVHATRAGHIAKMPKQAEAGHIRQCVDLEICKYGGGLAIERAHDSDGVVDCAETILAILGRGSDDAQANRLGEHQQIARSSASVRKHLARMHAAHDGQAKNRLFRLNGVPAHDGDARLGRLVRRATQDVAQNFRRKLLIREAHEIEGRQRFAAHGVNIAEGIGRCDGAKIVRPIDDGGEEIGRENEC